MFDQHLESLVCPNMSLPTLHGERVTLRSLTADDLDELVAIIQSPGVREWWWDARDGELLRENLPNDGNAFAIEHDGEVAGWLGFEEETDPGYRHASVDLSLHPRSQGLGLGPDAIRAVIRWLADERGHHRFTIDPSAANERAIKAYTSVGFRPVGVLRRYERDADGEGFHDSLLMDLLIEELR
jgi:aminoglycoside 6'-N-acetyltransferase